MADAPEQVLATETIDNVKRFHGGDLPVVSMYLGVKADADARQQLRSQADSLLHQIRPAAEDRTAPREVRVSLRQDIERIAELVATEILRPGTVAMFSCSGAGFFEVVQLPRAVRHRITVDATPCIRPMVAILAAHHRCCAAVVDPERARLWELYLGAARGAGELTGPRLPSGRSGGFRGLQEYRLRNRAQEHKKRHFRSIVTALDELFRADGYDLLAVGGHEHELPQMIELLPAQLRERLVGTFSVDDRKVTRATVRERAEAVLERYEHEHHRRAVAELVERAAAGGLATVDLQRSLWAGSVAAVAELFVTDRVTVPGVICERSGWLAMAGDTCPLCGERTRHTPDVINELVERVIDEGGSILPVEGDTALGNRPVAAALRFPLPEIPGVTSARVGGHADAGA